VAGYYENRDKASIQKLIRMKRFHIGLERKWCIDRTREKTKQGNFFSGRRTCIACIHTNDNNFQQCSKLLKKKRCFSKILMHRGNASRRLPNQGLLRMPKKNARYHINPAATVIFDAIRPSARLYTISVPKAGSSSDGSVISG